MWFDEFEKWRELVDEIMKVGDFFFFIFLGFCNTPVSTARRHLSLKLEREREVCKMMMQINWVLKKNKFSTKLRDEQQESFHSQTNFSKVIKTLIINQESKSRALLEKSFLTISYSIVSLFEQLKCQWFSY